MANEVERLRLLLQSAGLGGIGGLGQQGERPDLIGPESVASIVNRLQDRRDAVGLRSFQDPVQSATALKGLGGTPGSGSSSGRVAVIREPGKGVSPLAAGLTAGGAAGGNILSGIAASRRRAALNKQIQALQDTLAARAVPLNTVRGDVGGEQAFLAGTGQLSPSRLPVTIGPQAADGSSEGANLIREANQAAALAAQLQQAETVNPLTAPDQGSDAINAIAGAKAAASPLPSSIVQSFTGRPKSEEERVGQAVATGGISELGNLVTGGVDEGPTPQEQFEAGRNIRKEQLKARNKQVKAQEEVRSFVAEIATQIDPRTGRSKGAGARASARARKSRLGLPSEGKGPQSIAEGLRILKKKITSGPRTSDFLPTTETAVGAPGTLVPEATGPSLVEQLRGLEARLSATPTPVATPRPSPRPTPGPQVQAQPQFFGPQAQPTPSPDVLQQLVERLRRGGF